LAAGRHVKKFFCLFVCLFMFVELGVLTGKIGMIER
jgi:hypothetical protein